MSGFGKQNAAYLRNPVRGFHANHVHVLVAVRGALVDPVPWYIAPETGVSRGRRSVLVAPASSSATSFSATRVEPGLAAAPPAAAAAAHRRRRLFRFPRVRRVVDQRRYRAVRGFAAVPARRGVLRSAVRAPTHRPSMRGRVHPPHQPRRVGKRLGGSDVDGFFLRRRSDLRPHRRGPQRGNPTDNNRRVLPHHRGVVDQLLVVLRVREQQLARLISGQAFFVHDGSLQIPNA